MSAMRSGGQQQPRLSWIIIAARLPAIVVAVVVVFIVVNGFDTLAWCERNMRLALVYHPVRNCLLLGKACACLIMYTKCSNAFTITTAAAAAAKAMPATAANTHRAK